MTQAKKPKAGSPKAAAAKKAKPTPSTKRAAKPPQHLQKKNGKPASTAILAAISPEQIKAAEEAGDEYRAAQLRGEIGSFELGAGRTPKFRAEMIERTYKLRLLGLTNQEIADVFDVERSTFQRWLVEVPQLRDALQRAGADADGEVAVSLNRRARGYSHPETVFHVVNGRLVKTEVIKHYPPDTNAMQLWLMNRQPDRFRPRKSMDAGEGATPEEIAQLARDTLRAALATTKGEDK